MSFDYEEWAEVYRQQQRSRVNGQRADLEHFMQAEVQADRLTGDPDWDIFLQLLQAGIEKMSKLAADLRDRLCDPEVVNQDELMHLKLRLSAAEAQVAAWDAAIQLPKDIKTSGEQAKSLLDRLE